MRTALLAATALVALSSLAIAQDQIGAATEPAPKAKPINPGSDDAQRQDALRFALPGIVSGHMHHRAAAL